LKPTYFEGQGSNFCWQSSRKKSLGLEKSPVYIIGIPVVCLHIELFLIGDALRCCFNVTRLFLHFLCYIYDYADNIQLNITKSINADYKNWIP